MAVALGYPKYTAYEEDVRRLVREDEPVRVALRTALAPLTRAIEAP